MIYDLINGFSFGFEKKIFDSKSVDDFLNAFSSGLQLESHIYSVKYNDNHGVIELVIHYDVYTKSKNFYTCLKFGISKSETTINCLTVKPHNVILQSIFLLL